MYVFILLPLNIKPLSARLTSAMSHSYGSVLCTRMLTDLNHTWNTRMHNLLIYKDASPAIYHWDKQSELNSNNGEDL